MESDYDSDNYNSEGDGDDNIDDEADIDEKKNRKSVVLLAESAIRRKKGSKNKKTGQISAFKANNAWTAQRKMFFVTFDL